VGSGETPVTLAYRIADEKRPFYCLNSHFSNCTASRPSGTISFFVLHFINGIDSVDE
jgi:hypothetical protein